MLSRLRAWLAPAEPARAEPPRAEPPTPVADPRIDELATRLTTVARAQSKLSLRLDELSTQIDGNHELLLARLERRDDIAELDELLDALDRLDDATRSLSAEQPAIAQGLEAIAARLERFVAGAGLVRHAALGVVPEGRRFRVVGSELRGDLPEGVVTRVVRSAATRGSELVREGEVIINKLATP